MQGNRPRIDGQLCSNKCNSVVIIIQCTLRYLIGSNIFARSSFECAAEAVSGKHSATTAFGFSLPCQLGIGNAVSLAFIVGSNVDRSFGN